MKRNHPSADSEGSFDSLPLRIHFYHAGEESAFCDDQITLLYACIGQSEIELAEGIEILKEDQILVTGRMTPFRLKKIESIVLMMQIDSVYFDQYEKGFSSLHMKAGVLKENDGPLKYLIASIMHSLESRNQEARLKIERDLMETALYLKEFCSDEEVIFSDENEDYVKKTILWIRAHMNERITVSLAASSVGLSKEYLSRLFSKTAGVTLSDYIANERLNESLRMIRYGHQNISEIAMACGFPNYKSYYAAFATHYGKTPSLYRKEFQSSSLKAERTGEGEALKHLYMHLHEQGARTAEAVTQKTYEVDVSHEEGVLHKTWQRMMGFSNVYTAMGEDMRNQLRQVQKEIPFQYIRFHGIFSDDMKIVRRDEQGTVWYDFSRCDQLIDFFLANHLKPYIELGYMPSALASRADYTFAWKANVSLPKDINEWKALVAAWLKNEIERYGSKEVRTWYFEIWNSFGFPFSTTVYSQQEKLSFLKATWNAVKGVDEHLRLGVIDTYLILADYDNDQMLKDYFKYFERARIHPDFLSFSLYTTIFKEMDYRKIMENTNLLNNGVFSPQRVFNSENQTIYAEKEFTAKRLQQLHQWLMENTDFSGEIILNEWNLTPDSKDKLNDTAFKAPFFVYNALHCRDEADAFVYWTFSDIFEEVDYRDEGQPFHGGIGFVTNSGLKKPVWHALEFLNKLGNTVLFEDEDIIVTKSEDGRIQILLYNYCDFGNQGRRADYTDKGDRYAFFTENQKHAAVQISGVFGRYVKTTYTLNKQHGSVYDQWEQSGAPVNITNEMTSYLTASCACLYHQSEITCSGTCVIDHLLEPHEVTLITLQRI